MATVIDQVCTSCGNPRQAYGRYCLFCGDVLSEPTVKVVVSPQASAARRNAGAPREQTSSATPAAKYGGFWRRTWAGAIDVALEAAAALVITVAIDFAFSRVGRMLGYEPWISKFATGMAYILVLSIVAWLYCAFAESSPQQATIGKRIMGLRVVTTSGDRVSFGTATVRHFMKFLSLFTAGVGFMMAGWTRRRQALHDIPCDCFVVRAPQETVFSLFSH
jgi:uncharacterized RDD family membrane protein YckC